MTHVIFVKSEEKIEFQNTSLYVVWVMDCGLEKANLQLQFGACAMEWESSEV